MPDLVPNISVIVGANVGIVDMITNKEIAFAENVQGSGDYGNKPIKAP